jgi:hypothetical protein
MTYEQQLTFQLRLRGQSENEIAEVLREVRAHPLAGEESMESVFGTAVTYSESFEKKKRRTLGSAIVTIAVLVAVVCFIAYVVVRLLGLGCLRRNRHPHRLPHRPPPPGLGTRRHRSDVATISIENAVVARKRRVPSHYCTVDAAIETRGITG